MTGARLPIIIRVEGLTDVEGELHRFAAPLTVEEIVKRLPLEGFVARWPAAVYIITEVHRGVEKSSSMLAAGDIFYWSPEGVFGVALAEHVPRSQTLKIGSVGKRYSVLEKARVGSRMKVSLRTS
ncbi:MAG: cyclophilin-like family protein [Candidatus Caldarchaeum sp.]